MGRWLPIQEVRGAADSPEYGRLNAGFPMERLMRNSRSLFAVLIGSLALAPSAIAAISTGTLAVSASVQNSCLITGGTLAFGVYDTITGSAIDSSTTISVECTAGAVTTITLGQGANADTGSTDAAPLRRLSDGGINRLSYSLFTDAGRTAVWGNTAGTGKGYTAANANPANQTVYGRLTANQDVPAGAYTDSVVATITF